jgi:hypothetical protein
MYLVLAFCVILVELPQFYWDILLGSMLRHSECRGQFLRSTRRSESIRLNIVLCRTYINFHYGRS